MHGRSLPMAISLTQIHDSNQILKEMKITERDFYTFCPSATNPDGGGGVFSLIRNELSIASAFMASFLGADLHTRLTSESDYEDDELLILDVKRYICLAAFERAIPHLDFVLTPTGFGVVSNQNYAPASAERVERLRSQVHRSKDDALDSVLSRLRGEDAWCESDVAKRYFRSLVWRGAYARYFGYPNDGRTKIEEISGDIAAAERDLIHFISPEFHKELITAIRTASVSGAQQIAIDFARSYIYAWYSRRNHDIITARNALLSYLDAQIENFPTYRASAAFRANHFIPYENAKDDSCYFFG